MSLKRKMLLFAGMALLALAAPVSASASVWTTNGGFLGEGQFTQQSYKGSFNFNMGPSYGAFFCDATVTIRAEATEEEEQTNVSVSGFQLEALTVEGKPSPCKGTGLYYSGCTLAGQSNNLANGWNIDVAPTPATLTSPGGSVEIVEEYGLYPGSEYCGSKKRNFTFLNGLDFVPTLNANGRITSFMLEGNDEHGLPFHFGPFSNASPIFGLK